MSSAHHRTWQQYHVGHVNITVQLDTAAEGRSIERHQELATISRQLIATMNAERVCVTWVVNDPAHSAATPLILKSSLEHELAILGDENWVGPTAGRTRFARELIRRVAQARAAGLHVTSFAPLVASIEEHCDLIVKQHLTALVGALNNAETSREPRALHYGVWEIPVSARLPLAPSWFGSGKRSIWRRMTQTQREAGSFHLLVDAAALAAMPRHDLSDLRWLLRRLTALRDRGLIRVETLRTTAERLSKVPALSPQQSILRRAG
ncbi:MAG: hypothetical protein IT425_02705 [Pirellulales bacterium]|nr:hypothetical protein [Pirellulales bacterium]